MDEILAKLLESELLSEDTKAEISQKWTAGVETFKTQVREEVSTEVRAQLAEQWIAERDELVGKVDAFVAEALTNEITELKADIESFRDLEAEYAGKLVEEKSKMATEVAEELDALVDKIDAFFEVRLASEMEELKEDLELVKQNEFGRKIFEAFASTFAKSHIDEDSVQSKLTVTESKLQDAEAQIARMEDEQNRIIRESKMEQILAPLSGKKREQMAMVLKGVDTARLEESYKLFIGRILKEDVAPAAVVTESKTAEPQKTTIVTGELITENKVDQESVQVNASVERARRLAGIK